ncbi:hypothetical protein [Mycetocola reblochoni]|uniref:Uncharacterized protein n=2 Tax=Mycetocola reblochoni TaxID=331618 RepID=A0A1R4K8Q8_9MICO|nr:hypothetical protein [Mycetocola reblochoni]RLP68073.1 hypothetical protein D9V30_11230 [Mycetocola reblochoni]SJN40574.1 hypothetical protein FM119_12040 [Mycetocola reblochoni REB411]
MSSASEGQTFRPGIAVGLLAAAASIALVPEGGWRTVGEYLVTILAAIIGWYAVSGTPRWAVALVLPAIVLWNPIAPLAERIDSAGLLIAVWVAVPLLLLVAGFVVRVPRPDAAPSGSGASGRRR